MNATLLTYPVVSLAIQGLMRWFSIRRCKNNPSDACAAKLHRHASTKYLAPHSRHASKSHRREGTIKPLRVVHILETGQNPNAVGRMLISGRMADVCAELDRLAALEATPV